MATRLSRRESLAALASMALLPYLGRRAAAAPLDATAKRMRGAFMILTTPFAADRSVDWDDLIREVTFVDRAGAQGVVWPQGSSSVASLTKEERLHGMTVLAGAVRGKRVALVIGVQGKDTGEMLEYAQHANNLSPDAVIAMPPTTGQNESDYRDYFRALGKATKLPVIVQTSGGARNLVPSTELIIELAREMPNFGYVKEESEPVVERMKVLVKNRPPMKSVFGANFGLGWLYEMRLGLDGVVTGSAMYADVLARIWELHQRGDADRVRDAYSRFLLMRNLSDQIPGADLYVMKKRGIFKTIATRNRTQYAFSADEIAEIEYRFAGLAPYLIKDR
jgi:dihydrodipicolinate synthase/N-acetylneuraminate lyase